MSKWIYNCVLHTRIGKRTGKVSVEITGNTISGELDILNHMELLSGILCEDGSCQMSGMLHSLTKQIPFVAAGEVNPDSLKLTLTGEQNTYRLTGTAVKEKEE